VFPQVKIAHLRSLPAPPASALRSRIVELSLTATRAGLNAELRQALDAAVFSAFGISDAESAEIARFVRGLSPGAGLTVPFAVTEQNGHTRANL
jgi:hypothetical protein